MHTPITASTAKRVYILPSTEERVQKAVRKLIKQKGMGDGRRLTFDYQLHVLLKAAGF